MAPVSGILAHEIDLHEPREGMQLARISFDILGMIPARPSRVEVRTTRPGRTIELVEATLRRRRPRRRAGPRVAARRPRLRTGGRRRARRRSPDPTTCVPWDGADTWEGGYIQGLEFRVDPERRPGRTRAWIRTLNPLVDGETCSPTADLVRLADTANGIAVRVSPDEWMFPNVDLSVHLFREPVRGLGRLRHPRHDGPDRARPHVDDAARRAGPGRSGRADPHRAAAPGQPDPLPPRHGSPDGVAGRRSAAPGEFAASAPRSALLPQ